MKMKIFITFVFVIIIGTDLVVVITILLLVFPLKSFSFIIAVIVIDMIATTRFFQKKMYLYSVDPVIFSSTAIIFNLLLVLPLLLY